jgi:hypothetical protein
MSPHAGLARPGGADEDTADTLDDPHRLGDPDDLRWPQLEVRARPPLWGQPIPVQQLTTGPTERLLPGDDLEQRIEQVEERLVPVCCGLPQVLPDLTELLVALGLLVRIEAGVGLDLALEARHGEVAGTDGGGVITDEELGVKGRRTHDRPDPGTTAAQRLARSDDLCRPVQRHASLVPVLTDRLGEPDLRRGERGPPGRERFATQQQTHPAPGRPLSRLRPIGEEFDQLADRGVAGYDQRLGRIDEVRPDDPTNGEPRPVHRETGRGRP